MIRFRIMIKDPSKSEITCVLGVLREITFDYSVLFLFPSLKPR